VCFSYFRQQAAEKEKDERATECKKLQTEALLMRKNDAKLEEEKEKQLNK